MDNSSNGSNAAFHNPGQSLFDVNQFPKSRDWQFEGLDIKCGMTTCAANYSKLCLSPTLVEITAAGKCKGYHKRK